MQRMCITREFQRDGAETDKVHREKLLVTPDCSLFITVVGLNTNSRPIFVYTTQNDITLRAVFRRN